MPFVVRWLKDDEVVTERQFNELKDAKRSAKDQLGRHRCKMGMTSAVVCDADGKIVLRVF